LWFFFWVVVESVLVRSCQGSQIKAAFHDGSVNSKSMHPAMSMAKPCTIIRSVAKGKRERTPAGIVALMDRSDPH
jgi:hypothetical protein